MVVVGVLEGMDEWVLGGGGRKSGKEVFGRVGFDGVPGGVVFVFGGLEVMDIGGGGGGHCGWVGLRSSGIDRGCESR